MTTVPAVPSESTPAILASPLGLFPTRIVPGHNGDTCVPNGNALVYLRLSVNDSDRIV